MLISLYPSDSKRNHEFHKKHKHQVEDKDSSLAWNLKDILIEHLKILAEYLHWDFYEEENRLYHKTWVMQQQDHFQIFESEELSQPILLTLLHVLLY